MREHEVPTHVQAEDKVLLWFTFPQIVAVVAVCAVAYGAYHYLPFGPMAVRLGVGVLIGVVGIALTVGKVGGRGLPLVAADLLKFNLGARRYAGSPTELVISETPAPAEAKPDPLRLLAKKAASGFGKAVKAVRKKGRPPSGPTAGSASAATGTAVTAVTAPTPASMNSRTGSPRVKRGAGSGTASWRWRQSDCWPWSCCPPPRWPTTPTTRTRAGGWTKSTSCRRSRCRDAASTWSGWRCRETRPM